ncbi:MAG: hypothetical protein LQ339_005719 [Xanthoria mediterranea]|nr:MAG: hypothetical protein LQ339_005719 [Xanthoria mediterranea]
MQLQSSHLLTTLLSLLTLLATPTLANPVAKLGKQLGIPKGPSCSTGVGLFPVADAKALAADLQANNPSDMTYLPHDNSIWFQQGLFRICIYNDFISDNTHVTNEMVGAELQKIIDKCCKTDRPLCGGGERQGKGDSGLFIDYVTRNAGHDC